MCPPPAAGLLAPVAGTTGSSPPARGRDHQGPRCRHERSPDGVPAPGTGSSSRGRSRPPLQQPPRGDRTDAIFCARRARCAIRGGIAAACRIFGTIGCPPSPPVFESPGMSRPTSRELPRPGRLATARRKSLALELLSQGHTLAHVRKVLGINRVTVFRWRKDDPSFAEAYSDAMEAGTDVIEQEARRRAVDGYDRPVFQGGGLVGFERVYSDMLAALLLRGRRPEVYRDTIRRGPCTPSIIIHGGLPTEDDDRH
jgi:hypothetical protein